MKNTIKKTGFLFLLTTMLVLFAFSASAETYTGSCGGGVRYSLDTETEALTISGNGKINDYNFEDAPWHKYSNYIKTVVVNDGITYIGRDAFYDYDSIEEVSLPDSLTEIAYQAFNSCTNLNKINFPKNLTTINSFAFSYCRNLTGEIHLPDSLTYLGCNAFEWCEKITKVYLPDSITELTGSTFLRCSSMTEIRLPSNLTTFYGGDFRYCTKLKEINVPKTVTFIGPQTFAGCGLEKIIIPEGITEIKTETFNNCSNLVEITLPENLTNIKTSAFRYCQKLTSEIVIPDGQTEIGTATFLECRKIKSIVIPESVKTVGNYAFYTINKSAHIAYKGSQENWDNISFDYYNDNLSDFKYFHCNFNPETDIKEIVVPATCMKEGSKTTVCSCGYVYGEETLPIVDCSFSVYNSDNNATCLTDGSKTASCDYGCNSTDTKADEGSALGHDMSDFITTKEATCTVNGEQRADCSRCDYFEIKELIASNHTDSDHNGYCDDCKEFVADKNCRCICHAGGLRGFIYKLLWIIQKIFNVDLLKKVFGLGQICRCGIAHY